MAKWASLAAISREMKRLAWFVLIWALSVSAMFLLAWLIRWALHH